MDSLKGLQTSQQIVICFYLILLFTCVNKSKSDNRLEEISSDTSIASLVSHFEEVDTEDFKKYSNVANYNELKQLREKLYLNAFDIKREENLKSA